VNEAFRYAHALVAMSEERLVSVELTSADSAVVRIPPWPEAGEAIRSWLHATLDETLGADRSARLRTVSADSFGERFGHFGAGDRTIHFWLAPRGTGQVLRIRDEWRLPGASGEETQIRGTETAVNDLPEAYLPYLTRIPRLGGGTR